RHGARPDQARTACHRGRPFCRRLERRYRPSRLSGGALSAPGHGPGRIGVRSRAAIRQARAGRHARAARPPRPRILRMGRMNGIAKLSLLTAPFAPLASTAAGATPAGKDGMRVGGGPEKSKYSTLDQIPPANVPRLTKAWSYPAGGSELMPIIINSVMYFP